MGLAVGHMGPMDMVWVPLGSMGSMGPKGPMGPMGHLGTLRAHGAHGSFGGPWVLCRVIHGVIGLFWLMAQKM